MYSYKFKLQVTFKVLSIWWDTPIETFFSTAQNTFLNSLILMPLIFLPFFVSPLPRGQNISLWGLFSSKETKIGCLGWDWEIRVSGSWVHAIWGQKLVNTPHVWAGALINHPSCNGQMCWKSLQNKVTEAKCSLSQQH